MWLKNGDMVWLFHYTKVGKIYAGILVDRVCRMTGDLIDDKQRGVQSREWMYRSDPHVKSDR